MTCSSLELRPHNRAPLCSPRTGRADYTGANLQMLQVTVELLVDYHSTAAPQLRAPLLPMHRLSWSFPSMAGCRAWSCSGPRCGKTGEAGVEAGVEAGLTVQAQGAAVEGRRVWKWGSEVSRYLNFVKEEVRVCGWPARWSYFDRSARCFGRAYTTCMACNVAWVEVVGKVRGQIIARQLYSI